MAKSATKTSFSSVLDMPADSVERPKPLPVGSYVCIVQGQPRIDKSAKKGTEFSEFTLKLLEPLDDVDEDALKEYGGIKDKTTKVTFYHTENSIYRLKEFIEHCGVEIEEGVSLRQLIGEVTGQQVVAHVAHEASDDGQMIFARVKSTAAVE